MGPLGPVGPLGPLGPLGPSGPEGPAGPSGDVEAKGAKGDKGDEGQKGARGQKGEDTGDKHAIVEGKNGSYIGLTCVEMPEVRFEDVVTLNSNGRIQFEHVIDEEFMYVCVEDTIEAIGYTTSEPALCGIKVKGNKLIIKFRGNISETITIKLSGIRKGRQGNRFPTFTQEEMKKNLNFWSSWREGN